MNFVDLLSRYHIMPQFPPGAVRQAQAMPTEVASSDMVGRKDLTDKLIITIDGDDAKDFDDGVSLEVLENGNFCLGVHIADVTHYVKENSPIDRAAFQRGTSVYLVDTVIPMLPFELSNELCSLKPRVQRLAVSVFMEITPRGKVKSYQIAETVIKSRNRMTYGEVTEILDGDKVLCEKYSHLISMIQLMKKLADILNKKRVSEGSIEFETHESKITLDSKGKPLSVERYPITVSNNIIEEFMLICNVTVAKHLASKGLPCVYRVHEQPDLTKLERLGEVLPLLGVEFRYSTEVRPKDFQSVLKAVSGNDNAEVVSYLMLRSMAKAKYSEINKGHFGLGFDSYCHFTSPIRRYADLVVHRILKESLKGELSEKRKTHFKEFVVAAAVTASVTEVNAADAELDWKSVKKAEFMQDKIGEKYEGIITHILSSGFFVELPDTVEGFVAARTLEDDIYVMSENGVSMSGLRTRRTFSIGDKVKIKVSAVDVERVFVDFEVIGVAKLPAMRRKTKRKDSSKKEKRLLREMLEVQREEKNERLEVLKKADSEKEVFENAVISVLFDVLTKYRKFSRTEKGFVGVTLKDMAARVVTPVYRTGISDSGDYSLKNSLISASHNAGQCMDMLGDAFDFSIDEETKKAVSEFVCACLRHFEKCLTLDFFVLGKRENEYTSIARKYLSGKEKQQ